MFEVVLSLHSILRWGVVLSGLLVLIQAVSGLTAGGELSAVGKRMQLVFLICIDVQLLLGILLWTTSPTVTSARADMGAAMKDPTARYFVVEHGALMLLAVIVVHAGRAWFKRAGSPRAGHMRTALYSGVALLLILIRAPWPFMDPARPWIRLPF
jgi:cell division protein FtsW (lipid II flippase)